MHALYIFAGTSSQGGGRFYHMATCMETVQLAVQFVWAHSFQGVHGTQHAHMDLAYAWIPLVTPNIANPSKKSICIYFAPFSDT